jgi:hypothetical protein
MSEPTEDQPPGAAAVERHAEAMEIHKPKAAHSWREFAVEIGTIICGILIALGLEQGIEALHWRHVVEQAREALTLDHRDLTVQIGGTDASSACTLRRLDMLKDVLDQAETSGRLPPMGEIGPAAGEPWVMRSWEGLATGQALPHLPGRLATDLASQAARLDYLRTQRDALAVDWAVLHTMSGPGRRLSDAEAANLRAALGRAYFHAAHVRTGADGLGRQIVQSGLVSADEMKAQWDNGIASLQKRGLAASLCDPPKLGVRTTEQDQLDAPRAPPAQRYDETIVNSPYRTTAGEAR